MNIWFTSDTHYGHTNIVGPTVSRWENGYRNFSSLKEMNDVMIENINNVVKKGDILWHLGDWSFGGVHNILYFRNSIKCKNIHLMLGNHDKHIKDKEIKYLDTFFNPYDLFSSVQDVFTGKIGKSNFHLSHYSHQVWPGSSRETIHLFGHSHNNLKGIGKSMDVGVDCHTEFRPFHINEILDIMNKKDISFIDHRVKI